MDSQGFQLKTNGKLRHEEDSRSCLWFMHSIVNPSTKKRKNGED